MKNIRKITGLFLISLIFTFTGMGAQPKDQAPDTSADEAKLTAEIQSLFQSIKEKNEKARSLFMEAKINADSLKQQATDKLAYLDEILKKAATSKAIDQKEVSKAVDLQKDAKDLFSQYEYTKVLEKVKEALGHISDVPVVSITVTPQLFNPADGKLAIAPDIFSISKVTSWTLSIRKNEEGDKESVEIARWVGGTLLTNTIMWDGIASGRMVVDSAGSYTAELTVVDEKHGVGRSGPVRFKTDIFTTKTERGLLINISSIRFDYNKADLKPAYQTTVKRVFDFLLKYPGYNIVVEGHSDYTGIATDNQVLSGKRANSVADYLVVLGMNRDRIKVYGLGEALPASYEKAKAALSRRVSFILLKTAADSQNYDNFIQKLDLKKELENEMK